MTADNNEPVLWGAHITSGPQPWQVIQRDSGGTADVLLEGTCVMDQSAAVEVRVAGEHDNGPVPGCDWQDATMVSDEAWRISLRIPTGGLYRIETRVRVPGTEWRSTGEKIWHVAVGDVWVIAGQSNAVGYGHGPVVDPPALCVSVCGSNDVWRLATHPIFDPTGSKHPANRDGGWVDVSPWLSFGKDVLAATGVPIGLVPTALGGSGLGSWEPAKGESAVLWHNMVDMIESAGGKVAGMLWYQGESDASEENAPTYLDRFTGFVQAFRDRYGSALPIITAQLNNRLDGTPEQDEWWGILKEAQRRAAKSISNVAAVPTLDLPLSDAIHTSAIGNVILGQRFARIALGMVYGRDIAWKPVDIASAKFDGADRKSIRLSFENVVDHLIMLRLKPEDFTVEDEDGVVPIEAARVDGTSDVIIELSRPAGREVCCHNMFACKTQSNLRDHLQRPVLSFYGVEVEG